MILDSQPTSHKLTPQVETAVSRAIEQPGLGLCVLGSERTHTVVTSHDIRFLFNFFRNHPEYAGNILLFHQCRFERQSLRQFKLFEDLGDDARTCLSDLRLLSCPIDSQGVDIVLRSLNPSKMRRISMINVNATGSVVGESICHLFSEKFCLHSLIVELNSNNLKKEGAEFVGKGLRSLEYPLQRLDLSACSLGDEGGALILNSFSERTRISLNELVLDENDLGLQTLEALSKCLSFSTNLKELSLNDNPGLFARTSPSLISNAQLKLDFKRSIEHNGSLERIFLRRTGVTEQTLVPYSDKETPSCFLELLLEGLEANKSLRLLDVQKNKMPFDRLALLLSEQMPKVVELAEFSISIYGVSWEKVSRDFDRAFYCNFSLLSVHLELFDLQGGDEVSAYNDAESHYQLHSKLARLRQRNAFFRKAKQLCQSRNIGFRKPLWPLGLEWFAKNNRSLDSLYFCVCNYFTY